MSVERIDDLFESGSVLDELYDISPTWNEEGCTAPDATFAKFARRERSPAMGTLGRRVMDGIGKGLVRPKQLCTFVFGKDESPAKRNRHIKNICWLLARLKTRGYVRNEGRGVWRLTDRH